ncbi:hypothetical protein O6H91_08G074100 [Diphasiastrum complanatum]|uniref:Uncharacterized protein n=3 Tax=Diphasiastrum complanatum TaxID=34168 RepID=A0ACC2CYU5_DIPCM|nr:hypothetical protein O6H91_Y301000 [Diphasiastrum complanatum]KAJ7547196.1 hypothetical protein O6H91_08G074100 [Diphasiastrum complanatum]KAJ7547197.1 hypothetical protein O6H91_08G074100 [Diphasiastrum complanatum]KAJ7547198.1 hypothetical protein O6H91_08G074100 [Diphasiastrum complanatum]
MEDKRQSSAASVEDFSEQESMPSADEQEAAMRKKYGGLKPKKPPLISKDHERAFFDSADWALGKEQQGTRSEQKPRNPIEALRPKLQPTPHQPLPSRLSSQASSVEGR